MAETPDTNAAATDNTPSPFRRFPWVQLVFCVACLAMTAWTWMRYSYAWDRTVEDIFEAGLRVSQGRWPAGAYVRLHGTPVVKSRDEGTAYLLAIKGTQNPQALVYTRRSPEWHRSDDDKVGGEGGSVFTARIMGRGWTISFYQDGKLVDTHPFVLLGASRFTWQSVAGLVVGLMGCFVFGLYLRRWLVERKADFTTEAQSAQRTT